MNRGRMEVTLGVGEEPCFAIYLACQELIKGNRVRPRHHFPPSTVMGSGNKPIATFSTRNAINCLFARDRRTYGPRHMGNLVWSR